MPAISEATVEAVGGAVGAVLAVGVTYPLQTVSTWQTLDHKDEDRQLGPLPVHLRLLPSPFRELYRYLRSHGLLALYSGFRPCVAATVVSSSVYYYLYSAIRSAVVAQRMQRQGRTAPSSPSRSSDISVLESILVASVAGCVNVLLTNPAWVVATRMQAQQKSRGGEARRLGMMQVIGQLHQESGLAGFWKGLVPALVMVSNPTLQYIIYEWLVARLMALRRAAHAGGADKKKPPARLTTRDVFLLTALAKMGATLITYPLLVIKNRLQAMSKSTAREAQYTGVLDAVLRIRSQEGVRGFYKGMKVKMIQTVLAAALLMAIKEQVYHTTRAVLMPRPPHQLAGKK